MICGGPKQGGDFDGFARAAELVLETKAIVMDEKAARQVTVKGQADYVTQVDFAVQSYLKERLLALHPQAGFSGGGAGECGL